MKRQVNHNLRLRHGTLVSDFNIDDPSLLNAIVKFLAKDVKSLIFGDCEGVCQKRVLVRRRKPTYPRSSVGPEKDAYRFVDDSDVPFLVTQKAVRSSGEKGPA